MVYYNLSSYNSDMFLVGIFKWWYGVGWLSRLSILKERLAASADLFSIGQLIKTLFSPFRQISAGRVAGSIGEQLRAFADRSISRLVGAFVRGFMIIFGSVAISLQFIFGILVLIIWLVMPALPVVGLVMMVVGWVPK
jgi:hypothetical protein